MRSKLNSFSYIHLWGMRSPWVWFVPGTGFVCTEITRTHEKHRDLIHVVWIKEAKTQGVFFFFTRGFWVVVMGTAIAGEFCGPRNGAVCECRAQTEFKFIQCISGVTWGCVHEGASKRPNNAVASHLSRSNNVCSISITKNTWRKFWRGESVTETGH